MTKIKRQGGTDCLVACPRFSNFVLFEGGNLY